MVMELPKIVFVSSNLHKVKEVSSLLAGIAHVEHVDLDLLEIQSDDVVEIGTAKAAEAAKKLGCAALVEDSSLEFGAFGGLPGPFIKYFLKNLKPEGLVKLLSPWEDKSATAVCTLAYCPQPSDANNIDMSAVKCFVGELHGKIVSPRGSRDFGWECIFEPDGHSETYGEMSKQYKNTMSHRALAMMKFKQFVSSSLMG